MIDAYTREVRQSLGTPTLECLARQDIFMLITFIDNPRGYKIAVHNWEGKPLSRGEYPEYNKYKPLMDKIHGYLTENKYNPEMKESLLKEFKKIK